ncbi:MAG: tripartite tricarboxylate transporter substrate-binding protein, partial [Xenophilus sp.]
PYKGGAAALTDGVSGHVPLVINSMPACMPHVEAKRLKVLAIANPERSPKLPGIQTFAETVPGVLGSAWYGVLVPAQTPAEIQKPLAKAIIQVLELPDVKAKLAGSYIDPLPAGQQEFAKFLADEISRWKAVVQQTGITLNT